MKTGKTYLVGYWLCMSLLGACGPTQTEPDATLTATVDSHPSPTQTVTLTPSPTYTPTPTILPTPTLLPANITSYELSNVNRIIRLNQTEGVGLSAVAYADFDRDGYLDAITAPVSGTESGIPVQLFKGGINKSGTITWTTWTDFTQEYILGDIPEGIAPRKAIIADFNGDGYPDVYVADHGYDFPPYPGAMNILLLSDGEGHLTYTKIPDDLAGYHHGAAAGDIDNDGDIDIFTSGFPGYLLINDGKGNFSRNRALVSTINFEAIYTSELIDIDQDGFIDLIVGGHEFEGAKTTIYWGNGSGEFRSSARTILSEVFDYGIVIDIDSADINEDGLNDLILTRAGSPPNREFYFGYYVQIFTHSTPRGFVDESDQRIILPETIPVPWNWITWIKVLDIDQDGDFDLVVNDTDYEWDMTWKNDGAGYFTPE